MAELAALLPKDVPGIAWAFLILFARIGAIVMLLPVFSDDAIPGRIRLLLAFAITLGLWGLLSDRVLPLVADPARSRADLPGLLLGECLTGLALGTIVRIVFQAAAMAGSIISLQVGLTSALVPDTTQGGAAMVLSRLMGVAAAVACLGLSVHHLWIASMVHSYASFPPGVLPRAGDFAALAVRSVTQSSVLAVGLAAPLLVYGIVFNVALGLSARLAPALQIFFVAQPLNLLLGFALVALTSGALITRFAGALEAWSRSGLP
jgi:flagellar biosynthesis protein FliR